MKAFEDMKVLELRTELKSRGLPVGGLKAVLIQRLHDHDESADAVRDDHRANPEEEEGQGKEQEQEHGKKSTAEVTRSVEGSAGLAAQASAAATAAAGNDKESASPAENKKEGATAVAADVGDASAAAAAPVLKSTRSKTRRASMASAAVTAGAAAATTTKPPAKAAAVSDKATVAAPPAPASPSVAASAVTPPAERRDGGGSTRAAAAAAAAVADLVDESSYDTMLAKGAGLLGLGISAACVGWGDGLTAGNLAILHVALAGLFVAAAAANRRRQLTGSGAADAAATAARVVVTVALALVLREAWRQAQQQQPPQAAAAAAAAGGEGGMASLLALVSGAKGEKAPLGCENPAAAAAAAVAGAGAGDGGGSEGGGDAACLKAAESPSPALEVFLAWVGGARSVVEGGEWRAVRFGVIEFWGWASVAGYMALVEALPVVLQPLHAVFRRLERGHNILLAVTSAAMLVGIIRSCITSGKTSSLHAMLCGPFAEEDPVFDLTSKVFFWSKAWEWFDTALLVAKGKHVSWLQYTHHASTAILTALNMVPMRNAMWSVVCSLNSFVHTWMYAYYGFPRSRLLRRSKVWLTWAQMLQHMIVLASATYVVYLGHTGAECHNNTTPILAGLGLYVMYLTFFALFYRRTYGGAKNKNKPA